MKEQRILEDFFRKKKQVEIVYLFGSRAAGRAGPISDYDFAILLKKNGKRDFLDEQIFFTKELGGVLHTSNVDVLILNEAPPRVAHQVLKYGKVIFQRKNKSRALFEAKTENMYLDYKYFYEIGDKFLLKSLEDGTFGEG